MLYNISKTESASRNPRNINIIPCASSAQKAFANGLGYEKTCNYKHSCWVCMHIMLCAVQAGISCGMPQTN